MSVISFIQHYQRSIEKSQDEEDRLLHCLQKLHGLQVRVSHLQATGVGRTVNALRKRQGPVSDAARKLVARWKQIVEAHVSSEDEAPEKAMATGQQEKSRSNFETPQSLTLLTHSSSSGSETSSKPRQMIQPASSDEEPAYHRSPSPTPNKKSKLDYSPTSVKHGDRENSLDRSSEGEAPHHHSPAYFMKSKHDSREKSVSLDESSEEDNSRQEAPQHHSPAPKSKHVEKGHSRERSNEPSRNHSSSVAKHSGQSRSLERESSRHHSSSSVKKNKHGDREKSHSLDRSSEGEPSRHLSPVVKKNKHNSREKSSERESSRHHSSVKKSSSREKSHSSERNKEEKKSERHSREKSSSSSRDNKSSSHSSHEKSSKERNRSDRDKHSHEKNEHRSVESHKSKHKDEKDKDKRKEYHHSTSKRESSSNNNSRSEHKSSSNHHSSSSKSKKSDNLNFDKTKIKIEKWNLEKIDLEDENIKRENLLKQIKIKSEPGTSFGESSKYKLINSETSSRRREEPRIKKEIISSDEDDGASFGDALGALDLPVPKFKKEEPRKKVKIDPTVRVKVEPVDSGDESPVPASFEDALGFIDYSPSKSKVKKEKKKKFHGYPDYVKPLPKSEELAAILDLPSMNYRPLPQIPLRQQRTTASELDALAAVISNKTQRTKVFSGNKCFHGEIPSLQDMCIKILQENIDDIEYIGYAPFYLMEPVLNRASAPQLANIERHNPRLAEDTDDLWKTLVVTEFRGSDRQDGECWKDVYERSLEEKADKLSSISAKIKLNNEARKLPQRTTKLAFVNTQVKPPRSVMRQQAKHGTSRGSLPAPRPKPVPGDDQPGPSGHSSQASTLARTMGMLREGPSMSIKSKKRPAPLMQKTIKLMKTSYRR